LHAPSPSQDGVSLVDTICAKAGKIDASAPKMRILFSSDTPFFIARLRADIERIIEFLLENKPAISWAETGWSF
jgi:hypothetical protein